MTPAEVDAIATGVIVLGGLVVAVVAGIVDAVKRWRADQLHRQLRSADAQRVARASERLPEHERCSCGACATWRRQEFGL